MAITIEATYPGLFTAAAVLPRAARFDVVPFRGMAEVALEAHRPLTPIRSFELSRVYEVDGDGADRRPRCWQMWRYQSWCGQLAAKRMTMRRLVTSTSAATLMSKVRQVQG
jgi:hypothetical protein